MHTKGSYAACMLPARICETGKVQGMIRAADAIKVFDSSSESTELWVETSS